MKTLIPNYFNSADFLTNYWTKKPVLKRKKDLGANELPNLFNWQIFNGILNNNIYHLSFPDFRLVSDKQLILESEITERIYSRRFGTVKKLSPDKIKAHIDRGATVVLDNVEKIDEKVGQLANELSYMFGDRVQVNSYFSQPLNQGFDTHFDLQEVFIIQTEGSKSWTIFSEANNLHPTNKITPRGIKETLDRRNIIIKEVLYPGDILYIPRGVWHHAVATHETSLHLTAGVYTETRDELCNRIINHLLHEHVELRRNARMHIANRSDYKYTEGELCTVINLLKKALAETDVDELMSVLNNRREAPDYLNDNAPFLFPNIDEKELPISPNTKILFNAANIKFYNYTDKTFDLIKGKNRHTLPIEAEFILNMINNKEPISFSSLQNSCIELHPNELDQFIRKLVKLDVIRIFN